MPRERVDWHDFDFVATTGARSVEHAPAPGRGDAVSRTRVPTNIQFPGQPRDRFWEFEDAKLSLARIDATTSDLGRLALVEFSTLYGNDWFTFPIPVTYGSHTDARGTRGARHLRHARVDRAGRGSAVGDVPAQPAPRRRADARRAGRDRGATGRRRRRGGSLPARRDGGLVWAVEQIVTDADGTRRDLPDEYLRGGRGRRCGVRRMRTCPIG